MKLFKRIPALFAAVCLAFGLAALCACGESGEQTLKDPVTYTATVQLEDGTPVEGVKVKWGNNGPYTTDAQGVAKATLEKGTYELTVDESTLPAGTAVSGTYTVTAGLPKTTITLSSSETAEKILYTVKVELPDGSPAKGIRTGLCLSADEGGSCTFLDDTDETGTATISLPAATYNVQIPSLPAAYADYTYDKNEHNYYTGAQATAENPTVTIRLKLKTA